MIDQDYSCVDRFIPETLNEQVSLGEKAKNQILEILDKRIFGENFYQLMHDYLVAEIGPDNVTKVIELLKPELLRTADQTIKGIQL